MQDPPAPDAAAAVPPVGLAAGVLGLGLLLQAAPLFAAIEELTAIGRLALIVALGGLWCAACWRIVRQLPQLSAATAACLFWLIAIAGGTAVAGLREGGIAAAAFALHWGAWAGLALCVGLGFGTRHGLALLCFCFTALGLLTLLPIAREALFGVELLRPPTTVGGGGVERHYGLSYSISVAGFQVAAGALAALFAAFEGSSRSRRAAFAACALLLAAGLPLTTSRLATLAFIACAIVLLGFVAAARRQVWPALGALAAMLLAMAAVALAAVPDFAGFLVGALSVEDAGNAERLVLMASGPAASPEAGGWFDELRWELQGRYQSESSVVRLLQQAGIPGLAAAGLALAYLLGLVARIGDVARRGLLLALLLLIGAFSVAFDLLKAWIGLYYASFVIGLVLAHATKSWRLALPRLHGGIRSTG